MWDHVFTYVWVTMSIDIVLQLIKLLAISRKVSFIVLLTYALYTLCILQPRTYWWDFARMRGARAFIIFITTLYTIVSITPAVEWWPQSVGLLAGLSELVYNTAFVLSAVSLLKYLSFYSYFGDKIQLIKKMVRSTVFHQSNKR